MEECNTYRVLVVDDEPSVLRATESVLLSAGFHRVALVENSKDVLPCMAGGGIGVVVLDLFMPGISGMELLPELARQYPEVPVVVITAAQDVDTAVLCMKEGAIDYLVKPVEDGRLIASIRNALEMRMLRRQVGLLKHYLLSGELRHGEAFAGIITRSQRMRALFQYVEAVAVSSEPILIHGETGAGKEGFANAIHKLSGAQGQFVQINVAGLDDNLFSDTLFGHRKGAFTGAEQSREGLVAQAEGGTLFLDEIGDLAMASQVKLLRLLQEQKYYPLGSDVARICQVRVVCATNSNLEQMITENRFRADLYFRLSVHQIDVPPLREHREDIPLLVCHFMEEAARSMGKPQPHPPAELFTLLENHAFPGNVRELRAMVYNAIALHRAGPVLSMESFRHAIQKKKALATSNLPGSDDNTGGTNPGVTITGRFPTLKEAAALVMQEALRRANGNQGIAALMLGISRPALNRRLSRATPGDDSPESL